MLSSRKLKAIDRQGGAYLVLPWPAELRRPSPMPIDEERPATQAEHTAAMRLAAPIVREANLIHIATQVARLRVPTDRPDLADEPRAAGAPRVATVLLAHVVTPRWQRVTTPGQVAPALWP